MQKLVRLSRSVGFIPKYSPFPPPRPYSSDGDLPAIPGVGVRNSRKLAEKGIEAVADLQQLYRDKFYGASSKRMVEFLQSFVGITHKHHAESIAAFIKESVDGELKKRLTFCVEGNIGAGKSTFLQRIANEMIELRDLVEIVPEPIDAWRDIVPDYFNILDAFYAEPQRFSYDYQTSVFVERVMQRIMQEKESSGGLKPLRLMERSVFSDQMVFVQAVYDSKNMNAMEVNIYNSWFYPVVSCFPGVNPDAFIYLKASPDTCHKRMKLSITEEGRASPGLEYLRHLNEKHESWLLSSANKIAPVDYYVYPNIGDRVFYLAYHGYKVPALVLDFEPNINFNRDIEAKREYARLVAEFFEFVKKKKEAANYTKPARL